MTKSSILNSRNQVENKKIKVIFSLLSQIVAMLKYSIDTP